MHKMPDQDFYRNVYMGTEIPEKQFSQLVTRARQVLDAYKRSFRVESSGQEAEKLALCAMAERLYQKHRMGITSERVGNVSVSYGAPTKTLEGELYRAASVYLDFYRGVSQ